MVYVVRRTNIYLEERQLDLLSQLARQRDGSVAELVREAIDVWLHDQGIAPISESEWERRFHRLLERRNQLRQELTETDEDIERDVAATIKPVLPERAAGRV